MLSLTSPTAPRPSGGPRGHPCTGAQPPPPRPPLPCCPGRGRRSPFAPERLPAGRSQKVGRAVGDPQSGAWQHLLLCGQCVPGTSACSPEPATPQAPSEGPVRPTSPGPLTTSPPAAFPVQCPRGLCLPPTVPHLFLSRLCPRQAPADPRPGVGSQAPPTAPGSVPAPSCQALPSPQAKHPPA